MVEKENLFAKFKKKGWDPFVSYGVVIKVKNIVGGLPMNPELVEGWINATNKDKSAENREAIRSAHLETLPEIVDDVVMKQGIGFARIDGHLAIEGRQLKAMLKEAGNIIKPIAPGNTNPKYKGKGFPALKSKVADQVFVLEEYVLLTRDGKPLDKPDEIKQQPIHVQTARGERTSIKVMEIVHEAVVTFKVKRLTSGVPEQTLMAILDYGQNIGLGANRSQGNGKFEVASVVKVEK